MKSVYSILERLSLESANYYFRSIANSLIICIHGIIILLFFSWHFFWHYGSNM